MQDLLHTILAKHTGQTVEKIRTTLTATFSWMPEAVEYGIIDEVLIVGRRCDATTTRRRGDDERR